MRTHPILLLAVGLTLAACDDSGGPPTVEPSDGRDAGRFDGQRRKRPRPGWLSAHGRRRRFPSPRSHRHFPDRPPRWATHVAVARYGGALLGLPGNPARRGRPFGGHDIGGFRGHLFADRCPHHDHDDRPGLRPRWIPRGSGWYATGGPFPRMTPCSTRLDPGSRTIALTGLTPNCTVDGPGSRTVTIVDAEVAPIEFAVACTATSGVIGVTIEASGESVGGEYQALLDGTAYRRRPGRDQTICGGASRRPRGLASLHPPTVRWKPTRSRSR